MRALMLIVLFLPYSVRAGEVQVAVAANFARPMAELAERFTRESGHQLRLTPGASGKFHAQIVSGAPFDVLLSADSEVPRRLDEAELTVPGSRFTYAVGRLVLWSAQPGVVDRRGQVLRNSQARHLAIANPRTAPYGAAAMQVLRALGVEAYWKARLVQGENIAQTQQFIASGNAELGFVACSQVLIDGRLQSGSGWLVPATMHEPIRQDAVLLRRAADNQAAHALLRFLRTEGARAVMRRYGYGL